MSYSNHWKICRLFLFLIFLLVCHLQSWTGNRYSQLFCIFRQQLGWLPNISVFFVSVFFICRLRSWTESHYFRRYVVFSFPYLYYSHHFQYLSTFSHPVLGAEQETVPSSLKNCSLSLSSDSSPFPSLPFSPMLPMLLRPPADSSCYKSCSCGVSLGSYTRPGASGWSSTVKRLPGGRNEKARYGWYRFPPPYVPLSSAVLPLDSSVSTPGSEIGSVLQDMRLSLAW